MTIQLSDTLRPLPVKRPERKSRQPKITLVCKGEKAWLSISAKLREQMGLDPKVSHKVVILASRAQIGVQPVNGEPDEGIVRTLSTGGRVNVPELVEALHLKDGERFEIMVGMEGNVLVGPMPNSLFTRRAFVDRKNGRAA